MFLLGHLGIGSRLFPGARHRLPAGWLYFGCVLPDLIDKPLYYGLKLLAVRPSLITGTRTFGHTGLFLLLLSCAAALTRSRAVLAVAAGVASHLLLDIAGELVTGADMESSIWSAILFPLLGVRFPVAHFHTMLEHLRLSAQSAYVVAGELLGGGLLLRGLVERRRQRRPQSS